MACSLFRALVQAVTGWVQVSDSKTKEQKLLLSSGWLKIMTGQSGLVKENTSVNANFGS